MIQPSQDPGALVKKQSAWLGVPPVVVGLLAGQFVQPWLGALLSQMESSAAQ